MSVDPSTVDLPGLTRDELDKVTAPLAKAWTLPPVAYTDPEIYEAEKVAIFEKSWLAVARVDQVAEPGDYMAFTLLDRPLVLVHGTDGETRVMSRVCLHRAAPIIEGSGSRKLFTCPYHAWSYETTGNLVRAPLMEGVEGFNEKDCRLPQMRTEIWNGFIFVNLDEEAEALAPQIEPYTDYVKNYRIENVAVVETLDYESPWNWKVLVENFMEAYHHIATHSTTFEPTYHAADSFVPDNEGPYSILAMPSDKPHESLAGLHVVDGLEDWQSRALLATVIFPFFMLGIQSDLVAWYQVLPVSHDRFDLKIHICLHKQSLDAKDLDEAKEILKFGVDAIHQEDIAANDLVWSGLNAPGTTQGRLSQLEKSIWEMNQWWVGKLSKGEDI